MAAKKKVKNQQIVVIGHDPAPDNYGISAVKFKVKAGKVRYNILETKILSNTLQDMKGEVKNSILCYVDEVAKFTKKHSGQHVVVERYMSRGRFGTAIESVNQMIGALTLLFSSKELELPITQITAQGWKNKCNGIFILDKPKKGMTKGEGLYKLGSSNGLPAHVIDATLQAFFQAEKILGVNILERFQKEKERKKLIRRIYEVSNF